MKQKSVKAQLGFFDKPKTIEERKDNLCVVCGHTWAWYGFKIGKEILFYCEKHQEDGKAECEKRKAKLNNVL